MIEVTGEHVRLRPVRLDEVDVLWAARREGDGYPPGSSPGARDALVDRVRRSGEFDDGRLDLGIEAEGRLIGTVDVRAPRPSPPGIFEIGISLFRGERGRGYGREAVSLLCGYLFRDAGAHRVQGSTALDNVAMRRVFEAVGWQFEGVLRGFMPLPDGRREDYALYAVIRDDWARKESSSSLS
jgi:RimJ/RimL family protein N-acetyltransferase